MTIVFKAIESEAFNSIRDLLSDENKVSNDRCEKLSIL